ncbi:MAG: tRNA (adenosine(37)-N6)-dimethylallyltransferase MiaA [Deltaproteobacteria bacterium]|nr:tRNA (adenosine(37)-N6)-dimethylallyltransferase MiaA [Deltaproteobacteria bacterium]
MKRIKIVAIVGPTAAGKTALAITLARLFDGEIISADSMQVYRGMDTGTAKPSKKDRTLVHHHLIDVVSPDEDYSAACFERDAEAAIADINLRGKRIFLVGGAGLYVRAVLAGLFEGPGGHGELRERFAMEARLYGREHLFRELERVDPLSASRIHPNNIHRVMRALEVYCSTGRPISQWHSGHGLGKEKYETLKVGLIKERDALYRDIEKRVDRMVEDGLAEEVQRLLDMGFSPELKPMRSLGYREMGDYLSGARTLEDAVMEIKKNTRNYAKRQITWFKKDKDIAWFSPEDKTGIIALVRDFHACKG